MDHAKICVQHLDAKHSCRVEPSNKFNSYIMKRPYGYGGVLPLEWLWSGLGCTSAVFAGFCLAFRFRFCKGSCPTLPCISYLRIKVSVTKTATVWLIRVATVAGNTQRVVQNIIDANYTWPHNLALSPEAKDLVNRIFVPQCSQRITIDGIIQHPWYTYNLPAELRVRCPVSLALHSI